MKKASLFLFPLFICLVLIGCSNGNIVETPSSAEDYIGVNFETVVSELQNSGFQNIQTQEIMDLTSSSTLQDGDVGTVSIDGETAFDADCKFKKDVPIIVTYHTIKKVEIPLSSQDLQSYDYLEIADLFSEAGFSCVTAKEVFDLDPETTTLSFQNEVLLHGKSIFDGNSALPFDAPIVVTCHKPYETYEINILVDFIPNLIFNRYDIHFLVDGDEHGFMQHGKDGSYTFTLKNGSHVLSFVSADSDSVKGEFTLDVDSNIDASFKISCGSDKVNVETIYIDYHETLAPDEAKTMSDKYGLIGKNYETVVETLNSWGFTNIKTQPQYDIVWGFTETGSVANVTIRQTDDYRRGTIFKKNDEVIVNYHLPESDDPTKPSENETSESKENPVFYSTNTYEIAQKGNTGVFSYKSSGSSYDIYWIIDFDAGYVYYFTEGNGESSCDRLKIDSGTLNDKVIITYHDNEDEWSYNLHFKYVNHPETLILVDNDGFDYQYSTTDLESALQLRSTKTIRDY